MKTALRLSGKRPNGTVDGPVDVATITKYDDFQWVKNKDTVVSSV